MDGTVLGNFSPVALSRRIDRACRLCRGLVVSGIWLHIISPIQTAVLIVGYGSSFRATASGSCAMRCNWRTVPPFILGGAIGVPLERCC